MATTERDVDNTTRMSEHEALMWNIEKDPWLNPNGATVTILDRPVDVDRLRAFLANGVTKIPRLHQRVVPGLGGLTPPTWAPDPEFDLEHHIEQIELPAPGSMRQLLDLAARLYQQPMDRTRPLWRFVAITGLEGGKGAIYLLTHHVIADGIGQLRMAELYQQLTRDEEPPPLVDLDAFMTDRLAEHEASGGRAEITSGLLGAGIDAAGHVLGRQLRVGRRVLGEAMMWPADPGRLAERASEVATTVRTTADLMTPPSGNGSGGSPLWRTRSRHRHLEHVQVPLDDLKTAAKTLGGSVNDGFMAGVIEGAHRYHADRDTPVQAFNTSFVVSTRTDNKVGGNSFTPVPISVSGAAADFRTRIAELQRTATEARSAAERSGGIDGLSGLINLLPTSVVTKAARRQAQAIDFATSNLRGAPFPIYCAGAEVETTVCMGPLAGTAINATAMSYNGAFDIGLFIDPTAVEDPGGFRDHVQAAFDDLVAAGRPKPAPKRSTGTKKKAAKKTRKKST